MKLSDLKREHFPNGQSFSQKSLDQYIEARAQAHHAFLTRYLGSLAVGVVVGFAVLMLIPPGSMLRILFSMLAVMIAALVGTRMTTKSLDALREATQKISLTKANLREAKKHLKNGTVAWEKKQGKIEE